VRGERRFGRRSACLTWVDRNCQGPYLATRGRGGSRLEPPRRGVCTSQLSSQLAERARKNVKPYENVSAVCADGNTFKDSSFDAISINAGATEIQPLWLDQLNEGGRLLVPLTVAFPSVDRGPSLNKEASAIFSLFARSSPTASSPESPGSTESSGTAPGKVTKAT